MNRIMPLRYFVLAIAIATLNVTGIARAAELLVLVPMTAGKQELKKAGPKGEAEAPIVRRASGDALTQAILREATRGATKFVLDLDERAQRIAGATQPVPTYLLASNEVGGFARRGFWLSDARSQLTWQDQPYVNMTVDKSSLDDGSFEEEFAHEMGHVLLRRLIPRLPNGLSRTAHSSLAITDYPTAFDEGFAIHLQGVARQLTQNPSLKALDQGLAFKPFLPYWQSNVDRTLRLRGMRDNLFVQQQLPAPLNVGDATSLFDLTRFKNGQQMLSSEGVVATLFYHLMLDPSDDAAKRSARYQSLLISLRALNAQKLTSGTPLFLNLVRAHIERLPAQRAQWLGTVLNLTYGATASTVVLRDMTQLAALGQEGRADEFAAALKKSRAALAELTSQVTRNPQRLGAAVGPELWVAIKNTSGPQTTLNLNTAEKTTLMGVLGFESGETDLLLADRWSRGAFKDVADFAVRRNASPSLRKRLTESHALALSIGGFQRQ